MCPSEAVVSCRGATAPGICGSNRKQPEPGPKVATKGIIRDGIAAGTWGQHVEPTPRRCRPPSPSPELNFCRFLAYKPQAQRGVPAIQAPSASAGCRLYKPQASARGAGYTSPKRQRDAGYTSPKRQRGAGYTSPKRQRGATHTSPKRSAGCHAYKPQAPARVPRIQAPSASGVPRIQTRRGCRSCRFLGESESRLGSASAASSGRSARCSHSADRRKMSRLCSGCWMPWPSPS